MSAREMYQAYLRGEVTTEDIDRRAREVNAELRERYGWVFPASDDLHERSGDAEQEAE